MGKDCQMKISELKLTPSCLRVRVPVWDYRGDHVVDHVVPPLQELGVWTLNYVPCLSILPLVFSVKVLSTLWC